MKKKFILLGLILTLIFSGCIQVMAENNTSENANESNTEKNLSNGFDDEENSKINDEQKISEENKINKNLPRMLPQGNSIKVVRIGPKKYDTLEAALEKASIGDTITVIVPEIKLENYIDIPGEKNLTLDLNKNKMIFAKDNSGQHNMRVGKGGSFTIKNGKITAEDVNKDGKTSPGITIEGSDFFMDKVEAYNIKADADGGILNIHNDNYDPIVKITNSNFHDNVANNSGGAIDISNSNMGGYKGKYSILNCTFKNNMAISDGAAFGGAICISTTGDILIKGNKIIENEAYAKNEYGGWAKFKWSVGGGIYISSNVNAPAKANVTLEDNLISKNKTQFMGGGVYLELTKSKPKNDEVNIKSGVFSYNYSGYAGGGLDYSAHNQPLATMENVIITGNKAISGGGIWACPTSRVRNHSTFGAAIIENKLEKGKKDDTYKVCGTDVRFEGSDTKLGRIKDGNDPNYNKVSVQDRTFLGNKVNWYADDPDALYKPGNPMLTPDKYTNRSTSFGLFGEILAGKNWYRNHEKQAKIIFIGNVAEKRGGAISTNSDIDFGQPNMDVNLEVSKKWLKKDGKELKENIPRFAKVKLIRKDAKGVKYDLETVKLDASNNWSYKFENLPSKGYVNGKVLDFSYEVAEVNVPNGFKCKIKKVDPKGNAKYEYCIENIKQETPKIDIPVRKIWNDKSNKYRKRPDFIIIKLFANKQYTGKSLKLTKSGNWEGKFKDLDVEKDGEKIIYTIEETPVKGYESIISAKEKKSFIITNTYKAKKPKNSPDTGDNTPLKSIMAITLISVGLIYVAIRKRKELKV